MAGDGLVRRQARGAVLVLSLARPPVNALNAALMAALAQALREAEADPTVSAVVLTSDSAHFSVGLDVSELGRVQNAPLADLASLIENLSKPVIAALAGNALGGALELALACHGRIADEGARLGLPEIALGLLPVAGSTQRLPRLVGAPVALKMLLDGGPLTAVEALAMGLLDRVVDSDLRDRAQEMALELAAKPLRKTSDRRDGMRDPVAYQSAIADSRKRLDGWRMPAPMAVVDCVEAALLLPFDMGLTFESAQAQSMAETPEAAGLRHGFVAERRAVSPPADLAATARPPMNTVTMLGTGLGSGVASLAPEVARMALAAGIKLQLVAADRATLTEAMQRIAARQEAMVAEGVLTRSACEADWARLTGVVVSDDAEPADLVLLAPDAPRLADLPGPAVSLSGRGPLVLYPAPAPGGLAQLAVAPNVPLALQSAALAFGRKLGWRVMVQGPGTAIDLRLRQVLSRAIAVLEHEGLPDQPQNRPLARPYIASVLASFGLGAGARPKLPAAPEGAAAVLAFCLASLMNEGARILSEGAVRRPSDVDAAALMTGLFPRWEGGPMYLADQMGLMALRADLRARALAHPQLFTPAPVIDALISEGQTFAQMNR